MFENIIGQSEVTGELDTQIRSGSLPSSLLFFGPKLCGKSTTALELARALTCREEEASWSCSCRSCEQHRLLAQPYTKLLGARSFLEEILAATDVLRREDRAASRYLVVRAVRKLLRRFDPELWEDRDRKINTVSSSIEELNDLLEDIGPAGTVEGGSPKKKTLDAVVDHCRRIEKTLVSDSVPVDQIRRIAAWAHTTAAGTKKIVVIENANRMGDSSENALLKLLEEPPPDTYIVLITSNRGALRSTIRSRLRPYRFARRSPQQEKEVLTRIFREESDTYEGLEDYFLAWRLPPEIVRNQGRRFLRSVLDDSGESVVDIENDPDVASILEDRTVFLAFLRELLEYFGESLAKDRAWGGESEDAAGPESTSAERTRSERAGSESGRIDRIHRLERWTDIVRRSWRDLMELNMSVVLVFENLYVSLKENR